MFSVLPTKMWIGIIFLLALFGLIVRLWHRRRRREYHSWVEWILVSLTVIPMFSAFLLTIALVGYSMGVGR